MPASRSRLGLILVVSALVSACDRPAGGPPTTSETQSVDRGTAHGVVSGTTAVDASSAVTGTASDRPRSSQEMRVGHIVVKIKSATIGKVPLKSADGSI